MIESFFHLWGSIPVVPRVTGEFLFSIIFLRGIIASDITSWLEDRGFIKQGGHSFMYRFLDFFYLSVHPEKLENAQTSPSKDAIVDVMKRSVDKWTSVARKVAIVQHGLHGHQHDSVVECEQGKCGALFTVRA